MIGLFWKDFYVLRKQLSYYLIFLVIYGALVVGGVMPVGILGGIVVLVGMMIPMSSFSYDDMARWDKYAVSTPAGRQGLVAGKYFFAAVCVAVGSVLVALFQIILSVTGLVDISVWDALSITGACLLISTLLNSFILPVMVKFGAEKSRIITIILFVGVFGGAILVGRLTSSLGSIPIPPAWLLNALPVVLVLAALGGYAISYFISLGIMARKEL